MDIPKIHEGEYRFCLIMWEHEPVTAMYCCAGTLNWPVMRRSLKSWATSREPIILRHLWPAVSTAA